MITYHGQTEIYHGDGMTTIFPRGITGWRLSLYHGLMVDFRFELSLIYDSFEFAIVIAGFGFSICHF